MFENTGTQNVPFNYGYKNQSEGSDEQTWNFSLQPHKIYLGPHFSSWGWKEIHCNLNEVSKIYWKWFYVWPYKHDTIW